MCYGKLGTTLSRADGKREKSRLTMYVARSEAALLLPIAPDFRGRGVAKGRPKRPFDYAKTQRTPQPSHGRIHKGNAELTGQYNEARMSYLIRATRKSFSSYERSIAIGSRSMSRILQAKDL